MKVIATLVLTNTDEQLPVIYQMAKELGVELDLDFVEEVKPQNVRLAKPPEEKKFWRYALKVLNGKTMDRSEFIREVAELAKATPKVVGTRVAKWVRDGNLTVEDRQQ